MLRIRRNKIFKEIWSARQRYIVMKGSAGSGKSFDTAQFYILRLLSESGRNLVCVRKIYDSHRFSTYSQLSKAISSMGLSEYFTIKKSPFEINCINGNQVLFVGTYDEGQKEKLKSITALNGNITDVWIEEATELSSDDFEIIDDRLRGVLDGDLFYQIRLTFNPVSATHWIKRKFFDFHDDNVLTHHSTYLDNSFCDDAYKKRMERRRKIDPEGFMIYGLGQWGESGGLVFSNFEIVDFKKEEFDYICYGQDFGFNHANAILKVGFADGDVYVIDEVYLREKSTDEIITYCNNLDKNYNMFCDSAEPDRIRMWQKAGFRARGVKKYAGSVKFSIDWLKQRKIYIKPCCRNLIDEISVFKWKKDNSGNYLDEVVNEKDDAIAALRYACFEHMHSKNIKTSSISFGIGKEKIQVL